MIGITLVLKHLKSKDNEGIYIPLKSHHQPVDMVAALHVCRWPVSIVCERFLMLAKIIPWIVSEYQTSNTML